MNREKEKCGLRINAFWETDPSEAKEARLVPAYEWYSVYKYWADK